MSRTRSRTRTATSPVNAGRRYLRDPHQMQMNLKYRVRAPSVFRHPLSLPAARLLKPSPVRRGLQPSQTGTVMITTLFAMLAYVRAFLIARHRLAIEAVALRQQ